MITTIQVIAQDGGICCGEAGRIDDDDLDDSISAVSEAERLTREMTRELDRGPDDFSQAVAFAEQDMLTPVAETKPPNFGGVVFGMYPDDDHISQALAPREVGLGPREVGLGLKVESVLSVDTVACTFTAVLKVSLEWELTHDEHAQWKLDTWRSSKGRPPWEPRIELPGAQKIEMQQELPVPYAGHGGVFDVFDYLGKFYTIVYRRYRCSFAENYELNNFPFDCQDLTIAIQSSDASKAKLRPRFKRKDFASMETSGHNLHDWAIHPPVGSFTDKVADQVSRSGSYKSEFVFQVKLKRRNQFFVNRIIVLAGLLTMGSLLTWSLKREIPHRLTLCFTLLLTMVAFQLSMSSKLPNVSYYTLLDYYLVYCQRFIMCVALQHAVINKFEASPFVDKVCWSVSASVYLIFQGVFILTARARSTMENEKLPLNPAQLERWMAKQGQLSTDSMQHAASYKLNSDVKSCDLEDGLATYAPRSSLKSE